MADHKEPERAGTHQPDPKTCPTSSSKSCSPHSRNRTRRRSTSTTRRSTACSGSATAPTARPATSTDETSTRPRSRQDDAGRGHRLADIVEHRRARPEPTAAPRHDRAATRRARSSSSATTIGPTPCTSTRSRGRACAKCIPATTTTPAAARRSSSRISTRAAASRRCRRARADRWTRASVPGGSPCDGPRDASG